MAKLVIDNMEFFAFHGCYKEEHQTGGKFSVDVHVSLPDDTTGVTDELGDTVNYEDIHRITKEVMEQPVRLIEHLAYRIIRRLVSELGHEGQWMIRVHKHRPPLPGVVEQTYIELNA
ncbi:MAG: dihydroneopterin aldolase [Bacteroidetes bacterium]|nr:dihydroneopterin aldolase [Bacteroidota bacterium]